jgi:hypothetical protein
VTRLRDRPPEVWLSFGVAVALFVYVRSRGAPLLGPSLVLMAHIYGTLLIDDWSGGGGCDVPDCDAGGTESVGGSEFCAEHAADAYEAVEEGST